MGQNPTMFTYRIRVPSESAHQHHEVVRINSGLQNQVQQAWNHQVAPIEDEDGEVRWWAQTSFAGPEPEPMSSMFVKRKPAMRQRNTGSAVPNAPEVLKATSAPIPVDVVNLAKHINSLPKTTKGARQYPSYHRLRYDNKLSKEVGRKDGRLSQRSKLREWMGDERLFSKDMWRYLTGDGVIVGE
jgi:hypothetical protein